MSVPGLFKNFVAAQKDASSSSDENNDQKMDHFRDEKSFEAYENFAKFAEKSQNDSELITALEELEALKHLLKASLEASPENQV